VKNLTVYSKCSAMHSHCHSERSAQHGVKNLTVQQERSAIIETMRFFTSLRSFRMTKRTLRSFRTTNKVIHCHSEWSAQHGVKNLTVYSKCSAMYSHCHSERSAQHGVKNLVVHQELSAMHSHCHSERSAQHGVKNLVVQQERSAIIETMRFFTSLRSFRMTKRTLRSFRMTEKALRSFGMTEKALCSFRTTNKVIHCHSERSAQHGVKNLTVHQERSAIIETMRFFTSLRSFRMTKRTLRSFRTTNKVIHCHSEWSAQHGVKNLTVYSKCSAMYSHCHSERSAQHGVKNLTVYSKCSAMYSHCHSERSEESHRIAMKCTSRSLTAPAACSR
jgi:DNA-binding sugar fermentation-stimulating protein